jgi:hypothetical protein
MAGLDNLLTIGDINRASDALGRFFDEHTNPPRMFYPRDVVAIVVDSLRESLRTREVLEKIKVC